MMWRTAQLADQSPRSSAAILALGALTAVLEGLALVLFIPVIQSLGGTDAASRGLEGRFAQALGEYPQAWVAAATVALLCIVVAAKNAAAFAGLWLTRRAEGKAAHSLRVRIFEQTLSSCIDYRAGHRRSDIVATISENSWKVGSALGLVYRVIICACTVLVFIALMALISVRLILVATLFIGFAVFIIRSATRRAAEIGSTVVEENKAFGLQMWESLHALQLIRSFGHESREAERFAGTSERLRHRLLRLDALWAIPAPVSEVVIIVLIGALILLAGSWSVGLASLAAFLSLLYRLQAPARELMQNRVALDGLWAAIADVASYLEDTREAFLRDGNTDAPAIVNSVELRDVWFRYAPDQPFALRGVSVQIPAARTTAIVGRSGAGKSSLFALLFRFHDPTTGEIRADGVPLTEFRIASWRSRLALMSQDVQLFNATIKANIAFGKLDASFDQIRAAAKVAHADRFIEALPEGYDTIVGDRGMRLSGGERQRIALARTILRNPDILLLDEATNSLDSEAEQAFQEALGEFQHRRTVVVIAHRLATVLSADQVIVLDHGEVREVGSPKELIARNGRFAELYHLQQNAGRISPAEGARGL